MPLKVAVVQINADSNKDRNIQKALKLINRAIRNNAKFILLPEVFNYRGNIKTQKELAQVVESIPGPSSKPFIELAKKHKVNILLGSLLEKTKTKKAYNTSVLIGSDGRVLAKYRKQNLFNAVLGKKRLNESAFLLKGRKNVTAKVRGFKAGLSVCYDLRFPGLYQKYSRRGVEVICVPSSFTKKTGQAHWETLLRARAIENLCYVLAPNQTGKDGKGVLTYGNSMIIDPWGCVLAKASSTKEEIIFASLSKGAIKKAQQILPSIQI